MPPGSPRCSATYWTCASRARPARSGGSLSDVLVAAGPNAGGPGTEGPSAERPGAEGPGAEGPSAEGPVAAGPSTEGPDTEGPGTEGPDTAGPGTEGPVAEGPVAEGPVAEGPVAEGPDTAGPGTEGPVAEGSNAEGPGTEEGSVEKWAEEAEAGRSGGRAPDAGRLAAVPRSVTDDSIRIHVCHSPVREAEVLHDSLLALFDAHRDLEPADVLVLTPDLDVYGPAIEAVFAAAGRIPCNVARARAAESRTLRAFLDILSLPVSRHGAEAVLAPLAAPAIRTRFGIGEADLATVRDWVREAGIRWGVDEAHRGGEDLPEIADHTWRRGLRRIVLGYAMADAGEPVAGLVPCGAGVDGLDGAQADGELLGRFVSYCEKVFGLRARLGEWRRPVQWATVLRGVVRDFLADGSERARGAGGPGARALARALAEETAAVRALVRDLENEASCAESPAPLEVVLDVLREGAHETAREAARLADGVTVASLGAGRIFPAGVVCVAGMNDGVFPRSPSTPSFDLVGAGRARRGDRNPRDEDRFAFLEALLAARRCFLVTYAGRGLRDDAPIPPSVLVDELKDYLADRFPGETFETRHPLQPFSPSGTSRRPARAPGGCSATPAGCARRRRSCGRGRGPPNPRPASPA